MAFEVLLTDKWSVTEFAYKLLPLLWLPGDAVVFLDMIG